MGSNQSSQAESPSSFSVDPSGNITYGHSANNVRHNVRERGQDSVVGSVSQQSENIETSESPSLEISTLENIPKENNELSLQEADEIATRMKLKYKANSAELAGKSKSVFEDIETDLIQCYRNNGHQPLNCLNLTKQYNRIVQEHRTKLLQGVDKKIIGTN